MKLFENLAKAIVVWLREKGHDVSYAPEIQAGATDSDWLSRAETEGRIILTSDKDFGGLIFRDRLSSRGVILLRLGEMTIKDRLARLQHVWSTVEVHPTGKFTVITANKIRVRDLATD